MAEPLSYQEWACLCERIHPREYGGGDDRWALYRNEFAPEVWRLVCDGDPDAGRYPFREFYSYAAALIFLERVQEQVPRPKAVTT